MNTREKPDILLLCDRISGYESVTGELLGGPIGEVFDRILQAPGVELRRDRFLPVSVFDGPLTRNRLPRIRDIEKRRTAVSAKVREAGAIAVIGFGEAFRAVLPDTCELVQGVWVEWEAIPIFVTLHPREALWAEGNGQARATNLTNKKRTMYEHWQAISARLGTIGGGSIE